MAARARRFRADGTGRSDSDPNQGGGPWENLRFPRASLVPRHRTVRVAVLGSSVQRAAASGSSPSRPSASRRRLVVGALVLLSLILITVSFRSSALDPVEGLGASVLRPFEVAADRVSRPFRDAASWTSGLFHAKAENRRLTAEVQALRLRRGLWQATRDENVDLRRALRYRDSARFPQDFSSVTARVLTNPSQPFDQTVTIAAGSRDGIAVQDVVVSVDGSLVGQVTKVFGSISKVMLITDPDSHVRATDLVHPAAVGIFELGSSTDSLVLDRVTKDKRVGAGDTIITAGSPANDQLPSLYPRGIPVGTVSSVGQYDTDIFKQIQVQPYADVSSLQSVLVLVPAAKATRTSP